MATAQITVSHPLAIPIVYQPSASESPTVSLLGLNSTAASVRLDVSAPFSAIRIHDAAKLNAIYPRRGIFKTAATIKTSSDQKLTIDLSPKCVAPIPASLQQSLAGHGLEDILDFFNTLGTEYVPSILSSLSIIAGTDPIAAHSTYNMNFRLCDYNPVTAASESLNGCGAHTDYGTFTIIFQDDAPGSWVPVPGDATVILTGWCAVILSGGRITAARHRVRRTLGVRRLSAVLFIAPDLNVTLRPLGGIKPTQSFSETIMRGKIDTEVFKEVMGKRWRYREGNEEMEGHEVGTQDDEIAKLIWA
ncbi:hypothetical protein BDV38DRAFT_276907 [Aspergillus pseudotamarii]|uniref:Fe2OG dioxygenase domain-containing protein n=1 Tax=Aspergillus pseudotamarii TaxID=132259 RepID=A0A5N6TBT2_ASPPS|nr:uncharacterized protein BDV38DRAFT_276907 [Aspergillus pseudotamarii]KAE8143838.1 hypothetical protein BDV38DRAFT_276907 [Aspergillus pseudotamarii]